MIRACIPDDLDFLLGLARQAYPPGTFDDRAAKFWLKAMLAEQGQGVICVRGNGTAGFASIMRLPWNPSEMSGDLVHLFADRSPGMEVVGVVRLLAQQAFGFGCGKFYIGSVMADLSPIARRLGARKAGMIYVLENGDV